MYRIQYEQILHFGILVQHWGFEGTAFSALIRSDLDSNAHCALGRNYLIMNNEPLFLQLREKPVDSLFYISASAVVLIVDRVNNIADRGAAQDERPDVRPDSEQAIVMASIEINDESFAINGLVGNLGSIDSKMTIQSHVRDWPAWLWDKWHRGAHETPYLPSRAPQVRELYASPLVGVLRPAFLERRSLC